MNWLTRWIERRTLRAELADIEREQQKAKEALARYWIERDERLSRLKELEER